MAVAIRRKIKRLIVEWIWRGRKWSAPPLTQNIEKILVANLAHIGDLILTTSLLATLRHHFPHATLGVLCGSWAGCVVEGHPLVDRIHFFDHSLFDRSESTLKKKRHRESRKKACREIEGYDLFIDATLYPAATPLARKAGIKRRLGFLRKKEGFLVTHPTKWIEKRQSIIHYHHSLLEPLGIFGSPHPPTLPLKATSPLQEPFLLFHMGTGGILREWPQDKWSKLAIRCVEAGYPLVFTGKGARERKQIREVTAGLSVTNLCDQIDFKTWVAVIEKARLVVCVNTSAGHVAACFERPTVVLFCGTERQEEWGPCNPNATLLMKRLPCYPCDRACPSLPCLRTIEVEEVFAAICAKWQPPHPPQSHEDNAWPYSPGNRESRGEVSKECEPSSITNAISQVD